MEQKQIDEIEDSYTEEFIDETDLEEVKAEAAPKRAKKPVKKSSAKAAAEKKAAPEHPAEKIQIIPADEEVTIQPVKAAPKVVETQKPVDPWADEKKAEENDGWSASTWKFISGVLLLLLIIALFTDGFNFSKDSSAASSAPAGTPEVGAAVNADSLADDDAVKGNPNAPVTIVEFSDYQCPFCAKFFFEVSPQLAKNYVETGKVKMIYRDFPLDRHPQGQKAAEAAECAGEQGKYWQMHDYLFQNNDYLEVENLKAYAKDIGLNTARFNSCLDDGEMAEEVAKDFSDGRAAGVSGTPSFFINGKKVEGALSYAVFQQEIDAALAAVGEEAPAPPPQLGSPSDGPAAVDQPAPEAPAQPMVKEITLRAKKWVFTPSEVVVAKGDKVKLTIVPSDLQFTFSLPGYNIEKEVQSATTVEFTADKAGKFPFSCSTCEDWRGMQGTLVVQ